MSHASVEPGYCTRQHWAVFVFQKTFLMLMAIAMCVAILNVRGVTHHYLPHLNGTTLFLVNRLPLLALAAAALVLFLNYGLWQITSIRIAEGYLVWRFAWNRNLMPIKNMQDISITKSVLGAMLGYSTLVVQSGLTMEVLTYVPRAEYIVQMLRAYQVD